MATTGGEMLLTTISNLSNESSPGATANGTGRELSYETIDFLERISMPVVCLVGTVLNLMSAGAFLSKRLRNISCCLYLATRSLAVFGFLVSLVIAWSNVLTPLINTEGVCELTIFLSYFCPFLSVWMVIIVSVENFIRISQPSRVSTLCNPKVAKSVIIFFVVFGLLFYNFPLWTTRVVTGFCKELDEFMELLKVLNYIDAVFTLFCPLILMLLLVPLVGLSAISAYDRKRRLHAGSDLPGKKRQLSVEAKSSPEARVTHLLLAVSVVFLVLHGPFNAMRITLILRLTSAENSRTEKSILHVFRLIYNLDTCVSCLVYLIFGDNFRKVFRDLYFSRCPPRRGGASKSVSPKAGVKDSESVVALSLRNRRAPDATTEIRRPESDYLLVQTCD